MKYVNRHGNNTNATEMGLHTENTVRVYVLGVGFTKSQPGLVLV